MYGSLTKKPKNGLRTTLPYGAYLCADGRIVLFDRDYRPMFERVGSETTEAHPGEWVRTVVENMWFYDDYATPRTSRAIAKKCRAVLADFRAGKALDSYVINRRPGDAHDRALP
jgi:hypothetical protein